MNQDTVNKLLRHAEPWSALPEPVWPVLWQATRMISIPKHQVVFQQKERGKDVFFIVSGLVKLSKSIPKGKDMVTLLAQPGDTVGEQRLGAAGNYACRAQALSDSVVVTIDADWITEAAQVYPAFGWAWCLFLLERLRELEEQVLRHRFNGSHERLGLFLKAVARQYGRQLVTGEMELRLPLTHELIGEMAGMSRQRVTTIFNEWAETGIIRYSRQRILLRRPEEM